MGVVKGEEVHSLILFFSALHDVGKFSDSFQNLIPDLYYLLHGKRITLKYPVRHDILGQVWMDKYLVSRLCDKTGFPGLSFDPDSDPDDVRDLLLPFMMSSACHHGEPRQGDFSVRTLFSEQNHMDICLYTDLIWDLFCQSDSGVQTVISCDDMNLKIISHVSWVIAGLITLGDWIASSSQWFHHMSEPMELRQYWTTIALPSAMEAIRQTGLLSPPISSSTGLNHLFPSISSPHPMQVIAECCPLSEGSHLIILEDLCGNGKTEASLLMAHRLMQNGSEGIFFALPTMATANAMYSRIKDFYWRLYDSSERTPHLELTHSASNVMKRGFFSLSPSKGTDNCSHDEVDSGKESTSWLSDSRKKALLAQIGIGTIDQALMGILPIRHQSLRILGLCRNVLIIDEIHSFDPYMQTLICSIIEFQAGLGGSIILISATLPISIRQEFANAYRKGRQKQKTSLELMEYPLLTVVSDDTLKEYHPSPCRGVEVFKKKYSVRIISDFREISQIIRSTLDSGQCVAWIRNTVSDAVNSYRMMVEQVGREQIILFHARFTLFDRHMIEEHVIQTFGKDSSREHRSGKLIIATQVLEQSLDVDFDLLITDLAPVELMIQRAGRLHRHQLSEYYRSPNRGQATLVIFSPSLQGEIRDDWITQFFPKGSYVYPDHGRLYLSLVAFSRRKQITLPDDLRAMIEEVYGDDENGTSSLSRLPPGLLNTTLREMGKRKGDVSVGMMNVLSFSEGYVYDGIKWADDAYTPTRLSELSVPVFLGCMKNGGIFPLYGEGLLGWMQSEIFLKEGLLLRSAGDEEIIRAQVNGFPINQKGAILMVMKSADCGWMGSGWDNDGKRIEVRYNVKEGFCVHKDGMNEE